jgi:hypothetical protein
VCDALISNRFKTLQTSCVNFLEYAKPDSSALMKLVLFVWDILISNRFSTCETSSANFDKFTELNWVTWMKFVPFVVDVISRRVEVSWLYTRRTSCANSHELIKKEVQAALNFKIGYKVHVHEVWNKSIVESESEMDALFQRGVRVEGWIKILYCHWR